MINVILIGGLLLVLAIVIRTEGRMGPRRKKKIGRLIVSGRGTVMIPLEFVPDESFVTLVRPETKYITCMPVHSDVVECEVILLDKCTHPKAIGLLAITWDVEAVKEILWEAKKHAE